MLVTTLTATNAVSYTHLDVYKRQDILNTRYYNEERNIQNLIQKNWDPGRRSEEDLDPIFALEEERRGSGEFEQFIILCVKTNICVHEYLGIKQNKTTDTILHQH